MDGKGSSSCTGAGANADDSKRPPTPPSPSSTGSDVSALELDSTKETVVIPGGEASAQEAAPLVGAIKSEMPSGSNLNTSGQSNVSSTSSSSNSTDLPTCSTEQTSLGKSSSAAPSVGHTKLVVAIPPKPSSAPASLQHASAAPPPPPPARVSQSDPGDTASSLGYVRSSNVDTTSTDAPLDPPALAQAQAQAVAQAAAPTIADDEGVHVDSKFSTQPEL